ncbi:MAG: ImmA/IrrE family metallo-endopeptidase [Erythrobacter sp.]|uniref:ImmA/IrrE family metallo-endopeptidase n=1 Tax=Erythrobacter sp. TaxID=1042 RepID=UPI003C766125
MMTDLSYINRLSPEEVDIIEKFRADTPVRVGALAKALGLEVVLAALPLKISGLIKPKDEGEGFIIKVNRFEPKQRQRFTIAHEIGHYLLHRDRIQGGVVDSTLYRSKLSSRLEAEANRLAADLLMPHDRIEEEKAKFRNLSHNQMVEKIADILQVSKQAMGIRLGS